MLENKEIETIVNSIVGAITDITKSCGNETDNNGNVFIGNLTVNVYCDSYDDCDDTPSRPNITYNYNYPDTSYSDERSEKVEKAWDRFYKSNSIL